MIFAGVSESSRQPFGELRSRRIMSHVETKATGRDVLSEIVARQEIMQAKPQSVKEFFDASGAAKELYEKKKESVRILDSIRGEA